MTTFEDHNRDDAPSGSSDRSFGIVFGIFFLAVALLPLMSGRPVRGWALMTSLPVLLLATVRPSALSPLNRLWTRIGLLCNRISNPVMLALLFFLVITPTALIMRMLRRPPLPLHGEPELETYWMTSGQKDNSDQDMTRQF